MAEGQDLGVVSTQKQASTSVLTPEPFQKDVIHQTVNCVDSHLDKLHVIQHVAGKDRDTVQRLIDRLDNHDAALSL